MAATDARPVPRKNTAYRLPLAIRKNDGTLITTWAGQDSEVSLDGAAFADCTNEATEIGTSGCGYIDLTADEMNADSVIVKITVTNTDALPVVIVLYPEEAGDMRSDVTHWKGSAAPDNTGDAYARLGAPAGASIAADLLVLKGYVDCLPETWVVPAATGDAMTLTADYDAAKTAAQAGNAMALTAQTIIDLAAAMEAAIINELDGTAVMQAIADLIASDMTTTDLTVAAIATACRDAILNRVLSGNHDTAGTPGKLLQNCDAPISNVPTVDEFNARTVPAASIATSTQTAAILDAVGVVDTVVDAIKVKTDQLNFTGTDVKATLDGEEVTPTAASKTGYALAANGLDSITTTGPAGVAANFREMLVQVWRRFFGKVTMTADTLTTYDDAGTAVATTQTLSDDSTTQTQGKAASA